MTTFSFYSFRIFKISPCIKFKKFLGRILAPPSGRRPGADAPPAPPPLATPLSRPLRSASTTSLTPRRHRTVSYGRRLLETAASVIWNSLPNDLKCATNLITFKNHVKTFLFAL